MRRLLLVFAVVSAIAPLHAQQPGGELLFARFERYLEALRLQAGIPGLSAGVVGPTGLVWERSFGLQDLEQSIAVRADTPFHLDGLTEMFTAVVVLRCVEEGRLRLDDPIGGFGVTVPEPGATIRQVLSHTVPGPTGGMYAYSPGRLDWLDPAVHACRGESLRASIGRLTEQLAMVDAVPGPDALAFVTPLPGLPSPPAAQRFSSALSRLATSYTVTAPGRATRVVHPVATLSATTGLIASLRDLAQFDLALKNGFLLRPETLAAAWTAPAPVGALRHPHGLGWFVQPYKGERIVWQYGTTFGASSSLFVMVPSRGITLVLLANSDGLGRFFSLSAGDLTVSPFARSFLGLVIP